MSNKKEANLISFKVLLTKDNKLVTEISELPLEYVHTVFPEHDRAMIKTLLTRTKEKLEPLHRYLEREINALSI